ncbi:indolepyruvate ferredoxin oxidoreductase beta subunit [Acetoanaerobium pronyense]|uniref:Indolepyruvate ferredoxin oxidoreductase beta subunit n=1 Tax=Acetoanaerobium pronyense TaxID=1482736 RepID=A0ABS4KFY5_9FIRM|nr:indolepyruvate oxidoreductase subunit beta [Acetoanaerobium pronyense]MBP2026698.1 indolepyruvate ferredoxin oxidoreductase beta subunit [Acetoanaerobium pronyense]
MNSKNIILAGVGGQGLVLTTKIMSEAAFEAGFDVKTNDVIGLSQRGGKIWGSVKIGEKINSPNIAPGQGDILIAFEALEGRRWREMMKPNNSVAVINEYEMAPTLVQQEKEEYPEDIFEKIAENSELIKINATKIAKNLGNAAVANILMLGIAARYLDIPKEVWYKALEDNVPTKFIDMNKEAFNMGLEGNY